jgi:hypothetical protein
MVIRGQAGPNKGSAPAIECNQISQTDDEVANWLPTISKAGPFHPVQSPTILYTHGTRFSHGTPGTTTEGCKIDSHTSVYCVMIDQID